MASDPHDDEDAFRWEGDDSPTRPARPERTGAALPDGWRAVGKGSETTPDDDVAPPPINLCDHQRVGYQIAAAHALEPLRYRRGPLQPYHGRRIVVKGLGRDAGDRPRVEEPRVAALYGRPGAGRERC